MRTLEQLSRAQATGPQVTCVSRAALGDEFEVVVRGLAEMLESLASDPRVGAVVVWASPLPPGQLDALVMAGTGESSQSTPEFRDFGLTAREKDVAACLADGLSNRAIADALCISEHTVKSHLRVVFQKIGVASRTQAVVRMAEDVHSR